MTIAKRLEILEDAIGPDAKAEHAAAIHAEMERMRNDPELMAWCHEQGERFLARDDEMEDR